MPVVLDDTDARAADQLLGITATTDGVDAPGRHRASTARAGVVTSAGADLGTLDLGTLDLGTLDPRLELIGL